MVGIWMRRGTDGLGLDLVGAQRAKRCDWVFSSIGKCCATQRGANCGLTLPYGECVTHLPVKFVTDTPRDFSDERERP